MNSGMPQLALATRMASGPAASDMANSATTSSAAPVPQLPPKAIGAAGALHKSSGSSAGATPIMVRPLVSKDSVQTAGSPAAAAPSSAAINSAGAPMVPIQASSAPPSAWP